jgi:hypothetical protein
LNLSYLVGHCVQFMFNPDPIGEWPKKNISLLLLES